MEYVRLGTQGPAISRIGLGMMSYGDPGAASWYLDEERAEPLVRQAVEAGITFFDTADMYSGGVSEQITGRLLGRLFNRRDDYVLATKVFYPTGDGPNDRGLSRAHLMAAVDASLRRLGTDHIDLYQVHRWDNETPIDETMTALDELVRSGKVRHVGASLMYAWQFAKAQHTARRAGQTPFVSMQTRYNLAYREEEREMIPLCVDEGVGVLPYSPLARGLLAAAPDPGAVGPGAVGPGAVGLGAVGLGAVGVGAGGGDLGGPSARAVAEAGTVRRRDDDLAVVAALHDVAAERAVPPARIALAWLLDRPGVRAPILGVTKPRHIEDAVAALDIVLSPDEVARLEAPYVPQSPYGQS